jgi:hypothetical protein
MQGMKDSIHQKSTTKSSLAQAPVPDAFGSNHQKSTSDFSLASVPSEDKRAENVKKCQSIIILRDREGGVPAGRRTIMLLLWKGILESSNMGPTFVAQICNYELSRKQCAEPSSSTIS